MCRSVSGTWQAFHTVLSTTEGKEKAIRMPLRVHECFASTRVCVYRVVYGPQEMLESLQMLVSCHGVLGTEPV